jgi:predicted type IV restriction endonuclease
MIRAHRYRNETDVREAIVNRILNDLGWDVYNPDLVRREFTVEKRRVDYALFTSPNSPSVFVEVKAPNSAGEGDRQLFEYAFHQGAPFAILVDGREWSFFLPGEQGTYAERRVHKLDLLERDPADSAGIFERYLRFERVKSGLAIQDARTDYQSAARDREGQAAIPKAWFDLVSEPDELLIDLIAEKVVSLVGFRPPDEYVEAFLSGLEVTARIGPSRSDLLKGGQRGIDVTKPQAPTRISKPSGKASSFPIINSGARRVPLLLKGKRTEHKDAISALIHVLRELDMEIPNF